MPQIRHARRLLTLLVVALLAASCGDGGRNDPGSAQSDDGSTPSVARKASDEGITADTIKIGIIAGDLEKLVQIGFASDIGDVRSMYENYLVSVNASGGINGRRLEWVYQQFDMVSGADSMEKACQRLYDATTPFVVITSSGFVDAMPCITVDHDTPVVSAESFPTSTFAASDGNLFTIPPTSQVSVSAMVDLLAKSGALQGKKLGVLYGDRPGMVETLESGLVPALERNGLSLAAKAQITGLSSDPAAFAQFPDAIAALKGAGVDGLFLLQDSFLSTNFLTTAAKSGFTPKVFGADYQHVADPTVLPFIVNYQAESAFDGMLGITYTRTGDDTANKSPDPIDQGCVSRYEAARGPDVPKYGTQRWAQLAQICNQLDLVLRGLRQAGANPTHQSFREALAAFPRVHLGFGGQGSFKADKQDAADEFRVIRYDAATKVFVPVQDFTIAGRGQ